MTSNVPDNPNVSRRVPRYGAISVRVDPVTGVIPCSPGSAVADPPHPFVFGGRPDAPGPFWVVRVGNWVDIYSTPPVVDFSNEVEFHVRRFDNYYAALGYYTIEYGREGVRRVPEQPVATGQLAPSDLRGSSNTMASAISSPPGLLAQAAQTAQAADRAKSIVVGAGTAAEPIYVASTAPTPVIARHTTSNSASTGPKVIKQEKNVNSASATSHKSHKINVIKPEDLIPPPVPKKAKVLTHAPFSGSYAAQKQGSNSVSTSSAPVNDAMDTTPDVPASKPSQRNVYVVPSDEEEGPSYPAAPIITPAGTTAPAAHVITPAGATASVAPVSHATPVTDLASPFIDPDAPAAGSDASKSFQLKPLGPDSWYVLTVHTPTPGSSSRAARVPASAPGPSRFTAPPEFAAVPASVSTARRHKEKKESKSSKKGKGKAKAVEEPVPDVEYDDMFLSDD